MSRDSRSCLGAMIAPPARAARRRSASGEAIASPAATIAVSGERRSCETARSSAVLTIVRAAQRARLDDLAEQRVALERGARAAPRAPGPRAPQAPQRRLGEAGRDEQRAELRVPSRSGNATPALVALDRRAARSPPTAARAPCASRCATPPAAPRRGSSPRSSSRAISAARSASRRRWSASRGACARALGERRWRPARRRGRRASATQFSLSAIVKRPVGGMWKKLNASALAERRGTPSQRAPARRDEQHRDEVDDAERRRPARSAQRVDERGRQPPRRARRRATPTAVERPSGRGAVRDRSCT